VAGIEPVSWDPLHTSTAPDEWWTTGNIGEALPGVQTPLSWSLWGAGVESSMRYAFHALGAARADEVPLAGERQERSVRAFYGRAAIEVSFMCGVGDRVPGTSGAAICEQVLGFAPESIAHTAMRRRYPVIAVRMPWTFLRIPGAVVTAGEETAAWWSKEIATVPSLALEAARALFADAAMRHQHNLNMQATVLFCAIQPVYDAMGRLVEATGVGDVTALASGFGSVPETAVVTDLWRASRGEVSIEEVVRRQGFHGPREGELSSVVWREDDSPLRRVVGDYVKSGDGEDPRLREDRLRITRLDMERQILASLSPVRRAGARLLLRNAARLIPLRGVAKIAFMQAFDVLRASSRRIGELLAADGVLADAEDVFYLTDDEVLGALTEDVRGLVERRRERREVYLGYDLPPHWQGMPVPIDQSGPADDERVELTGYGVSPGVVEGRARVITDPALDDFEAGQILVSSTTDPSWASIMFVSEALVVDIGGVLSHAAVVARELGIPCVTNTGDASRLIRDGDLIRVDGGAGTVTILRRAGA